MSNSQNTATTTSGEEATSEEVVNADGATLEEHVVQQGPDTIEELNRKLHQIQLNKLNDFFNRFLKWR